MLDVNNALSAPTVTVVPLTSVKQHTDLNRLHFSKLFLGDEIYTSLQTEIDDTLLDVKTTLNYLFEKSKNLKNIQLDTAAPDYAKLTEQKLLELDELEGEIHKLNQKCYHLDRMRKEIVNMKRGSIALVGQITTVSKIRIYDPLYPADTLANIRLSPELMTKLDEKVRTLFTHNL